MEVQYLLKTQSWFHLIHISIKRKRKSTFVTLVNIYYTFVWMTHRSVTQVNRIIVTTITTLHLKLPNRIQKHTHLKLRYTSTHNATFQFPKIINHF